jgi:hypothetical protein
MQMMRENWVPHPFAVLYRMDEAAQPGPLTCARNS